MTTGFQTTFFTTFTSKTEKTVLYYQIQYPHAWLAGNVLLERESGNLLVLGAHFNPIKDSLEVLNRFTLEGKGPLHYVVLALTVLIPLFILYALILCIRSPIRRKWLWILFILFGFLKLRFDWTSGLYDFQLLSVSLFGAGVFQSGPYSPWIFSLAIPVGAIVFLSLRRRLRLQEPHVSGPAA
ncbi:MAG TPA: hypothetical protein VGC39_10945 [Candidatus Methylacidiphilales bacterium]